LEGRKTFTKGKGKTHGPRNITCSRRRCREKGRSAQKRGAFSLSGKKGPGKQPGKVETETHYEEKAFGKRSLKSFSQTGSNDSRGGVKHVLRRLRREKYRQGKGAPVQEKRRRILQV